MYRVVYLWSPYIKQILQLAILIESMNADLVYLRQNIWEIQ